jgi:hypothetical protein
MTSRLESIRIKAKLLQKAKKKLGKEIKLKDAYNILAKTAGYESWAEYKDSIESSSETLSFYKGSTLNLWFRSMEEAKEYQAANGGEIIAVEKDFIIVPD